MAGEKKIKLTLAKGVARTRKDHRETVRGLGLIWGIDLSGCTGVTASRISQACFARGLVIETCGRHDDVLKILPPLTISRLNLELGLGLIIEALHELMGGENKPMPGLASAA